MRLSEYASTRKTRGSYKMPRSVQQSIPIDRIYADGVWQSENVFSLMWQISDINYAMQSDAAKQNILTQLGTVYAGIPADCWMQVCIVSQRMDEKAFARDVLYHRENDGFDALRAERNRQIKANARENGNVVQHKYIIVSTNKPGVKEARERFVQVQGHAAQKQRIQDTFWAMHNITYEVEEVDVTPEPTEDDPDPEQQTEYILHITVSSKTVDELAELYNFTQDQNDILHELLSDEMRPSLLALCGRTSVADGELCWPLPGHTYISCNFGDDDAYGNSGHRGTDIPAPEGTPILAAHSGTVLVSGWNDSYGNQVLLDNGAGLSTRYAHMTQTAVTAGEAVTAGQVIGYVGNTGDSTGFHLHFEVMQNGVRVNPMDMVCLQEKKQ